MIIDCGNGTFFLFLIRARGIQSPQESQISLKDLGEPRDWGEEQGTNLVQASWIRKFNQGMHVMKSAS